MSKTIQLLAPEIPTRQILVQHDFMQTLNNVLGCVLQVTAVLQQSGRQLEFKDGYFQQKFHEVDGTEESRT